MPEAAFAVGHVRIDRGVVQVDDLLPGIALIVLIDRIEQRQSDAGTIALSDIPITLIDRRL